MASDFGSGSDRPAGANDDIGSRSVDTQRIDLHSGPDSNQPGGRDAASGNPDDGSKFGAIFKGDATLENLNQADSITQTHNTSYGPTLNFNLGGPQQLESLLRAVTSGVGSVPHASGAHVPANELPKTEGEAAQWFFDILTEEERAYILAVCILHGADAAQVEFATSAIISKLLSSRERRDMPSALKRPNREHVAHATRRIANSSSIVFADTTSDDASALRHLLCPIVADLWHRGSVSNGKEYSLGQLVDEWISSGNADLELLAARGWGWITAATDRGGFRARTTRWAQSNRAVDGLAAAAACLGAMVSASDVQHYVGEKAGDERRDFVFQLIRSWSERGSGHVGNNERWTAAVAWGVLAVIAPDAAEDGLALVSEYPTKDSAIPPITLLSPLILSWSQLAACGRLRQVIHRLASLTSGSFPTGQRHVLSAAAGREREKFTWQAYSAIASFSLIGRFEASRNHEPPPIEQKPAEELSTGNQDGVNAMMWLALSPFEEAVRQDVVLLTTASLGISRMPHEALFDAIFTPWAKFLATPERLWSVTSEVFIELMIAIARECRQWDLLSQQAGLTSHASTAFSAQVKRWATLEHGVLSALYQRVLAGLPS